MNQETLILEVTDMAFGGKGIARHEGKVYFVEGALAGDTVRAVIEQDKKKYADAKTLEILKPSADRVEVRCQHQEECGGCRLMPGRYDKQLQWKQAFVVSALGRIGKFSDMPTPTMIASPQELEYRNRVFLRARLSKGKLDLGYIGLDHHSLLAIESCAIAEAVINDCLVKMRRETFEVKEQNLDFRIQMQRLLNEDQQELVAMTLYPTGIPKSQFQGFMNQLQSMFPTAWIGFANETRAAPFFIYDQFAGMNFYTKPGIFQQVNRPANRLAVQILHDLVLKALGEAHGKRILDLCCGSGNLSLMLARSGFEVLGTESNPQSIEVAQVNLQKNQLATAQYICEDSNRTARRFAKDRSKFDAVLIDPPREGLKESIKDITTLNARDLFYLSCEPSTLARDLSILVKAVPHRIESIHCFDFFPHTWHVETLVHLKKES